MDEHDPYLPPPEALNPSSRNPATVLATSAPPLERPSPSREPPRRADVRRAVEAILDRLDTLGDRIAGAAGLR